VAREGSQSETEIIIWRYVLTYKLADYHLFVKGALGTLRVFPSWLSFAYPEELGYQDHAYDEEKSSNVEKTPAPDLTGVEANNGKYNRNTSRPVGRLVRCHCYIISSDVLRVTDQMMA